MGGLLSVIDLEVGWGVHTPWIVLIGFSLIFGVSWRGLRKTKRKVSQMTSLSNGFGLALRDLN